jgi:hypothetical protein
MPTPCKQARQHAPQVPTDFRMPQFATYGSQYFKKLPACIGMSRAVCLDFESAARAAALASARSQSRGRLIKGGVWSFDLNFLFGRAAGP